MFDEIFPGIVNPISLPWQNLKLRGRYHFDNVQLSTSTGIFVNRIYTEIICRVGLSGWMDELRFNVPFNSISFISGRWKGEHEKLFAMKRRLGSHITHLQRVSSPRAFDPKSGALTALTRGCFYNRARI